MLLEILPSQLFNVANVKLIFRNSHSAIMHKKLSTNMLDKEMYLSAVAILYIVKGKQIISNFEGKNVEIEQGNLLYLSKDLYLVSDFVVQDEEFEAVLFFFADEFIENIAQARHSEQHPQNIIPTLKTNLQICEYIDSLLKIYSNSGMGNELLELKLAELIALIKFHEEGETFLALFNSFSLPKQRRDIQTFMKLNYLKNLKVEDYALLTGRSKSTFIREFKSIYHTTPKQWLIAQRLDEAHQLLLKTNLNVTDIAFKVGYENVSHFIDAYKKRFSVTPKVSKNSVLTRLSY